MCIRILTILCWLTLFGCGKINFDVSDAKTAQKIAQEELPSYCKKESLDCSKLGAPYVVGSSFTGWFVMFVDDSLENGLYYFIPKNGTLEITPFGSFNKEKSS